MVAASAERMEIKKNEEAAYFGEADRGVDIFSELGWICWVFLKMGVSIVMGVPQ